MNMSRLTAAALAATLLTTVTAVAHAQEGDVSTSVRSGLGLGFQSTLSGRHAIEIDYHANSVTFTVLAGLSFFDPDADGADSQTALAFGAGAFFLLHQHGRASFHLGGRVVFSTLTNSTPAGDDASETDVELPLRVRLDVARHMSLTLEVGLALGLGGSDGVPAGSRTPADGNSFSFGTGNLFGSAGLTMYF
jgi:hypothetical protein